MLPENLAISVTDVLRYHQRRERVYVPARKYSAISLRLETSGSYHCKNKTISFEPGSVCIIPEGVAYERSSREEDILVIHLQMLNYVMEEIRVFPVPDPEKYQRLFSKALALKHKNEVGAAYRITSVVYEILSELTRDVGAAANASDRRIVETAEYMRQNLWDSRLSIEDLAARASVCPSYYRREFRRIYGTSPKEYLDTLRIRYARSLLETHYFSQKEIAARCGFSEVGYFRSVFQKKMGKCIRDYLSDETRNDY